MFARCPVLITLFFLYIQCAFAGDWKPVTEAEMKLKTPLVDKSADAEAIFWEIRIQDEQNSGYLQTTRLHYLRLKIFSERGRERAKVELTYYDKMNISSIAGRTIKADGRIVDMKRDAVFETQVAKGKGLKVKAKTFTLPDVEPGDMIEYQWKQVETDAASNYVQLPLQRDIPVETVRYLLKPVELNIPGFGMRAMTFHTADVPLKQAAQGYTQMEYHNMPAFREEPDMPPEDEVRAWVLVYYSDSSVRKPESYWPDVAKKEYAHFQNEIRVNAEMKKAAAEAVGGAATEQDKVSAIYAWVRKNVKNVRGEASAEEAKDFRENHTAADTLKQRLGTGTNINMLFASLALAAGLQARIALTGNRGDQFFRQSLTDSWFLRGELVAVKIGGKWKYFDPATPHLPCGGQVWEQQGGSALITDNKNPEWAEIPISKAGDSAEAHTAYLTLGEDGSLSGLVQTRYTGHRAFYERRELARKTQTERDLYLTDDLKQRFGDPEITNIRWTGADDDEKPLSVEFQINIPHYAQRTGKRLFVQPALFQRNLAARFPTSERTFPVYFQYPWSETDTISIEMPEGYELDHPEIPAPIKAGNTIDWKVGAQIEDKRKIIYRRSFAVGGDGNVLIPKEAYPVLRKLFDAIHEGEAQSLAMKQVAAR